MITKKGERTLITQHAGTVLVGQLAVMAFGITDTLVAGRYDQHALAALSVGSAVFISVFLALMGLLQALLPVLSERHGAHQPLEVGRQFRQGLYLLLGTTVLGVSLLNAPGLLLEWTHVPQGLRANVSEYLRILSFGLPMTLLFRMFSTLNQSIGKPRLVTWVQLVGLAIKIPMSMALTFGLGGFAEMGVVGCAWATLIVNTAMVVLCLGLLKTQHIYRPFEIWQALEKPHWVSLKALLRLGLPNALSVTVEITSFTLMALFIARQGSVASASHQIITSVAALMYMVPLSLSIATSARVSYWLGAQNPHQARLSMIEGFKVLWSCALVISVSILLLHPWVATLFSKQAQVAATAAGVLIWLSLYHWADATQVMCFFLLRCYKITVKPVFIYAVFLWGLGLMGGYQLAYQGLPWLGIEAMPTPKTFWLANASAVFCSASTMLYLLIKASQKYKNQISSIH